MRRRRFLQLLSISSSGWLLSRQGWGASSADETAKLSALHGGGASNGFSDSPPRIGMIAVGGAGCSILSRLPHPLPYMAQVVAVDANARCLERAIADQQIHIELTGLNFLHRGELDELRSKIASVFADFDLVLVLSGIGGKIGTTTAPVIAEMLKACGTTVIGIAVTPFAFEGARRHQLAADGLHRFAASADAVFPLANDMLWASAGGAARLAEVLDAAPRRVEILCRAVTSAFIDEGLVGIDLGELPTLLAGGAAAIGCGTASGAERGAAAVARAIADPLFGGGSLPAASGVMVAIEARTGWPLMADIVPITNRIRQHIAADTNFLFGAVNNPALTEELSVTVLTFGFPQRPLNGEQA